ncbi:hypothetical protein EYZ11_001063 [Aspergillus tanneri]|uniref:4a-hydroxytetrahydrobiopterin dehydratase n=1 Tax=Aspergillus tanneri TaxID=1220188 RepID=A0A4S3JVI4_9EURO|nr:hypothetical protein EYZ11_001063 [Aspergillus tanneri]
MDLNKSITFAEGVDTSEVLPQVEKLLEDGWVLNEEGNGLKKRFHFNTFTKVMVRHGQQAVWFE